MKEATNIQFLVKNKGKIKRNGGKIFLLKKKGIYLSIRLEYTRGQFLPKQAPENVSKLLMSHIQLVAMQ